MAILEWRHPDDGGPKGAAYHGWIRLFTLAGGKQHFIVETVSTSQRCSDESYASSSRYMVTAEMFFMGFQPILRRDTVIPLSE